MKLGRKLLWLVPLLLVVAVATTIVALPGFVAAPAHRGRIESLASALTGRDVHIGGRLGLGLLPSPEITATQVTITGPDRETITAKALTLDISMAALLRGQLSAQNLILNSPQIQFPWPLPGGPKAITPPPWLAALHAQIQNGDISLGAAHFTAVAADLFTGTGGSISISGTGKLQNNPVSLSLDFGAMQLTGATPVTLDAASGNFSVHFSGALDAASRLDGKLNLLGTNISGATSIIADGRKVTASAMQFSMGNALLTGTATLAFASPKITADLALQNFDFAQLPALPGNLPSIPVSLTLAAGNAVFHGQNMQAVQLNMDYDSTGTVIHALQVSLPGSTTLKASGKVSATGDMAGQASLVSPDLPGLLASYGFSAPPGWSQAQLSAALAGSIRQLALGNLSGSLGNSSVKGNLVLSDGRANGALNFDHLDLLPLLGWLGHAPTGTMLEGEVSATNASFGPVPLTHLLLDAQFNGQGGGGLNIRRVSANVFDGLAAGSLSLNPQGQITAANGFLSLPSAMPLAALLPPGWKLPNAVLAPRLNLALSAQGMPTALATNMTANLGDFSLTASPVLNLQARTANGAVTVRHPNAIAALRVFGLGAPGATTAPGCGAGPTALPSGLDITRLRLRLDCATLYQNLPATGLGWPGPGALSLRANFFIAPGLFGLPDFVLAAGRLTANGRIVESNGVFSGQIDADTLALPPIPANVQIPWSRLGAVTGKLDISANRVTYAGTTIIGPSLAHLTASPKAQNITLAKMAVAGGDISGALTVATSNTAPPAITGSFSATQIDAAQLSLPLSFPFTLPQAKLAATGQLTATGYSPKIWLATLGGTVSLNAAKGRINGFSLAALADALRPIPGSASLRAAMAGGSTGFTSLGLGAKIAEGNCTLISASLTTPEGAATATGSIDLFEEQLALNLQLVPNADPPITIGTEILGAWNAPLHYPRLKAALAWRPEVPKQAAPPAP